MRGRIVTCEHKTYDLPVLLTWDVTYTGSVPCDCFSVTCVYQPDMEPVLRLAQGFTLMDGENVLLRGFVDEFEIRESAGGRTALLAGRGYAGRLLDNESRAVTYQKATMEEILRNHVTPYGIACDAAASISAEEPYAVAAGSSQWKALADFCRTYGGFTPGFDRYGRLWADKEKVGKRLTINDKTAVTSLVKRMDHYGVLSEVLVIDKNHGQMYSVENKDFISRGGQCRRVMYTPGQTTWAAARYTGEYQIRESGSGETSVEVTVPGGFAAFPGDTVALNVSRLGLSGEYRVAEARTRADESGETTALTLKERE